jgi:hypothetical protein
LSIVSGLGQDMVQGDGDDVTSYRDDVTRDDVTSYSFPRDESEISLNSFGADDHGARVFPRDGGERGGREGPASAFFHASAPPKSSGVKKRGPQKRKTTGRRSENQEAEFARPVVPLHTGKRKTTGRRLAIGNNWTHELNTDTTEDVERGLDATTGARKKPPPASAFFHASAPVSWHPLRLAIILEVHRQLNTLVRGGVVHVALTEMNESELAPAPTRHNS